MSHILKTGKSKIKVRVDSVPGEESPGLQTAAFLLCLHMVATEIIPASAYSGSTHMN